MLEQFFNDLVSETETEPAAAAAKGEYSKPDSVFRNHSIPFKYYSLKWDVNF